MSIDKSALSSLNSVSEVSKCMPPCCVAKYVCYVAQNKLSNYNNEQV